MGSHPRPVQPVPGPGHKLGSPGSPSRALSKMTGHFLNSCAPYTEVFMLDLFPSKRQGKERTESLLGRVLSYSGISLSNRDLQSLLKLCPGEVTWGRATPGCPGTWLCRTQTPLPCLRGQRALSAISPPHCRSWHLLGLPFSRHRLPQAQKVVCFILILKQ